MILFPYKTDSSVQKFPVVNLVLTFTILTLSLLFYLGKLDFTIIEFLMLSKWNVLKLLGTILIQPDIFSIIMIVLFLLFLGNSINSIIGNIYYLLIVILFSAASSSVHLLTGTIPAIGAHGLISALAGFALMTLPSNKLIFYKPDLDDETGINIPTFVFFWALFDLYSILEYRSIVIIWSHLAGFALGTITGVILIKTKAIVTLNPTFTEWLHDHFTSIAISEMFSFAGKEKADTDIKTKAGRLLKLYDVQFEMPEEETEVKPDSKTEQEIPAKPNLSIRILRAVKQKDHITIYFVYQGEAISEISIRSEKYKCEIYPTEKIKSGDSGSIKIYSKSINQTEMISLSIKYNLHGVISTKEFIYSVANNELGK